MPWLEPRKSRGDVTERLFTKKENPKFTTFLRKNKEGPFQVQEEEKPKVKREPRIPVEELIKMKKEFYAKEAVKYENFYRRNEEVKERKEKKVDELLKIRESLPDEDAIELAKAPKT